LSFCISELRSKYSEQWRRRCCERDVYTCFSRGRKAEWRLL